VRGKPDDGLRAILHAGMPSVHWQAIEVGLVGRGVPDSNGCANGVDFWVECKSTEHWAVDLEPEQVGWLLRRARAGGRVFIAVRRRFVASSRRVACDELWLLRGEYAREVKDEGLRCTPRALLGVWPGPPARWNWGEVLAHLTQSGECGAPRGSPGVPPRTRSGR
jgi:hypothetical protein